MGQTLTVARAQEMQAEMRARLAQTNAQIATAMSAYMDTAVQDAHTLRVMGATLEHLTNQKSEYQSKLLALEGHLADKLQKLDPPAVFRAQ